MDESEALRIAFLEYAKSISLTRKKYRKFREWLKFWFSLSL